PDRMSDVSHSTEDDDPAAWLQSCPSRPSSDLMGAPATAVPGALTARLAAAPAVTSISAAFVKPCPSATVSVSVPACIKVTASAKLGRAHGSTTVVEKSRTTSPAPQNEK